MNALTAPLNGRQLQQALAILEREQPSAIEQRRFDWLNRSVSGVFLFAATWLVVLTWYAPLQIVPLLMTLVSLGAALMLLIGTLPLLKRLGWALWTERRLGISKHMTALTLAVTSRQAWRRRVRGGGLLALMIMGIILSGLSAAAFVGELLVDPPDPGRAGRLAFDLAALIFGLACFVLYPVRRCRQRLEAAAKMRAALAGRTDLEDPARDLITAFERTQILVARREAAAAAHTKTGPVSGMRFSRQFHESLSHLSEEELALVYGALPRLHGSGARDDDSRRSGTQAGMLEILPTPLTITFTRDLASGDVVLEGLVRR